MDLKFVKLTEPTTKIAECFERWENDPKLIPLIRPHKNRESLEMQETITVHDLEQRLEHDHVYLIYLDNQLVGEVDYQIDPRHLHKKERGTAWIGIVLGEEIARGKGIGYLALQHLEDRIKQQGLQRIELGVFEFNTQAIKLYRRAGYQEIGRIPDFTYWQDRLWEDIRMEKYIEQETDHSA